VSEERSRSRISAVDIDEKSLAPAGPDADRERKIAIFDLLEDNRFVLLGHEGGPYVINLSLIENRLAFDVREEGGDHLRRFILSLTALRRVIKDYFQICDTYYDAIRTMSPAQIEAIDMGRRGLHNEGSTLLQERLADKVEVDFDTARRLFTLVCALHARS
jgi:uncharacterized protein (UPF0262 family)